MMRSNEIARSADIEARKVGAMTSTHSRPWVVLAAACVAVVVWTGSAQAASVRVTKSDAKADLKSFGASYEDQGVILPYAGSSWDGRHFCALDWHTLKIGWVAGGDASFSKQDAAAIMAGVAISFVLDGSALSTDRTNVKEIPDPSGLGFVNAYFFNQGRVLSPAELAVGQHEVSMNLSYPGGTENTGITFFVDAAGTGACL